MRHAIALTVVFLSPFAVRAQPDKEDLAIRARAVLHKHCGACHGLTAKMGDLSVADRAGLSARPYLKPGSADASYLLDLIADGSMPPGTQRKLSPAELQTLHDWVDAGAPGYPKAFDEQYVVSTVRRDAATRTIADVTLHRYLSLAHLVNDQVETLSPRREALQTTLRGLSKADLKLEPVDSAHTIYRIDLHQLGWDDKPFILPDPDDSDDHRKPAKPSNYNLFDMILLEYPRARRYPLNGPFLSVVPQIAPVAFLEVDWLAEEFPKLQAAQELKAALGIPAKAAERKSPPASDLVTINPADARELILPFDALSRPNLEAKPTPFSLKQFDTVDPTAEKVKTKFKLNERMRIDVQANVRIWIDLATIDPVGEMQLLPRTIAEPGSPFQFFPEGATGYKLESPGVNGLILYAGSKPFDRGIILRDKRFQAWLDKKNNRIPYTAGFRDRFVHPFYTTKEVEFDPANVIKKTIWYEVEPASP